jgi:iron uptake system EfeUOB component EfeO/EfeM
MLALACRASARRHADHPEECRMHKRHRRLATAARPVPVCTVLARTVLARTVLARTVLACTVLAVGLAACASGAAQPPAAQSADVITVSGNQCGGAWQVPGPGWHTFEIDNQGTDGAEVDLTDPANGAIYAEIENTGPGTTTPMTLNLGSGTYAFVCLFGDSNPLAGVRVTVPGNAKGTQAIVPVTYNDTIPYAKKYQAYALAGLKVLSGKTAVLAADVRRGDLQAAKRDWLTAHLQYQTLGAAYGTFGDYDGEIDGRADATGVTSPRWTGFYRLEYGLWHGQSAKALTPVAATLLKDVNALLAWWPKQQIPLADVGLRTHEILENALQFQLTGHDDYGSGTTLATTLANIGGTRELLTLLRPLIAPRYPRLPAVYSGLGLLQSLIEKEHLQNGWWVPVSALPASARQAIDAACGAVLESLATIASITEPRNTVSAF